MNPGELFASIVTARPGCDDIVYVERSGDSYTWRMVTTGDIPAPTAAP